ncbi:putative LRR receptor-like serine/threonine-protein kinase [Acorus calamus]|uniref:non-specific serine/threonine protein kinase n=1 Tax=Acorus calamus TaxID=4465 RepID=A0AAV9E3S9_ACOCL|nr:putative LRR receptor-like serine/threonine-protein kinase [Acorus calamus]
MSSLLFHSLVFGLLCLSCFVGRSNAQAKTDPTEASALNTIFQRFGITATNSWNKSGELCSGDAIDDTANIDDLTLNPGIKCDCSFNNTCHIISLRIMEKSVTGPIPNEISTFKDLIYLKLDKNLLTGQVPTFLGNLSSLQILSIAFNSFFGPIPKELGQLKELYVLSFGYNNFTGPLPAELGNLINLQKLYVESCGASGEIPSSFANLRNLIEVWAMGNNFTGILPEFIGGWTSMQDLRFEGNSLQGPISSSFSSLTNLSTLKISDLYGGSSSSLDFIKDMKNLSILILRNNRISGGIPPNMNEYPNLQSLFLGNNSLSGSLPSQKNPELVNIDLSYNQLSGGFPLWVNANGLYLNLVANNFVIDDSNGRISIQKHSHSDNVYFFFLFWSVVCHQGSDGTLFDNDTENLGAASYYVTDTERWAVSNVGTYSYHPHETYVLSNLAAFDNTLDSDLFQNARQSPSSLRYYGLGLQKGNYTGNLVEKDFDIRKEAGRSFRTVKRDFIASVPNTVLEIHFFWAGKGTYSVPSQAVYGPLISVIRATPQDFKGIGPNLPPSTHLAKKAKAGLVAGIIIPIGIVALVLIFGTILWRRKQRMLRKAEDEELLGTGARPNTFSYAELRTSTEDFSDSNKLGEGGFGRVYKGKIADGREVAVKQLSVASHQGKSQFVTEIATISAVQHRNLVKLYGCCIEGERRILVYEYLKNKSLDQALFGKSRLHLDWQMRFNICLGTARGLAYLHEESRVRIVHRDVKASNILLDAELNPKISDFGLAKLYSDEHTHLSTRVAGTFGYLAPEYALWGHLTEKVDVFGFGVVALEIITGRKNCDVSLDEGKAYLLEWAWQLHEENNDLGLVDMTLTEFNTEEAIRVLGVALLCTQASPTLRPSMSKVVAMLSGDVGVVPLATRPNYWNECGMNDMLSFASNGMSGYFMGMMTSSTMTPTTSSSYDLTPGMSTTSNASIPPDKPSQPMLPELKVSV